MRDLRCMSFVGKDHGYIIAAGCQGIMLKVDTEKGRVVEKVLMTRHVLLVKADSE